MAANSGIKLRYLRFLVLFVFSLMALGSLQQAKSYDVMKRFSLVNDRIKTYRSLDVYNKGFYFDLNLSLNTTLMNLVKEVKGVSDIASANNFIQNNNGTEQGFGTYTATGLKLPKFKLFRVRFTPILQFEGGVGTNMGFSDMVFHFYNFGESYLGSKLLFRSKKRFVGHIKLHTNFKTDLEIIKSVNDLANGVGNVDIGGNLHGNLGVDYEIGYRRKRWKILYRVEDIQLMELMASKKPGTYSYGNKALVSFHGHYKWKYKKLQVKALAGTHQRSGHYNWSDTYYLGSQVGLEMLNGKLGLNTRFIMDPEHWNINLKLKGFIGHFDYLIKTPKKSIVSGVKVSAFHSISLRLFF